ncbi:hypothetical protein ElyMa_006480200 [Elysia marginata]|uniref:HTH psq-type domain-containing protein n=1 Tax=Elysia marginata TaxID=1093978 RepID=A0AAV4I0N3_9GAST|nr:hypothetical protein ElyMa_006480200 [Elysia marginata]
MVRHRKGERKIGKTPPDVMKNAVKKVKEGMPIRQPAKSSGITYSTLRRCVNKSMKINPDEVRFSHNYACRQVFTDAEEKILKEYLITACHINYGVSRKALRKLAWELDVRNGKTYPTS